jgi:hypothetical protein
MPVIAVTIVDQTVGVTQVGEIGPTGATGATGTVSAAGDGTAGAPGIAFASDTNTGLFRAGADILAVSAGGSERARFSASGLKVPNGAGGTIAISTDGAPGSTGSPLLPTLKFLGFADGVIGAIEVEDRANSASGGWMNLHTADLSGVLQKRVTIDRAGNSGFGTPTPGERIDVVGNIKLQNGTGFTTANSIISKITSYAGSANQFENASVDFLTGSFADGGQISFKVSNGTRVEAMRMDTSANVTPGADNTQNFGSGSLRWATIYAGTGTINTSDERYKVLREGGNLSDAEYRAWSAVRAIVYRDKDSFERKGDAARMHIGYSWQSIQAAFEAEGLNPARYGLWCEDVLEAPVEKTRRATRPVEGQTETVPVLDDDGQPVFEQVQETEEVEQPFEEVRMIDGAPVLVKGVRTVAQPVFDSVQIRDEDGELVFTDPDTETGEPIPRMAPVPRMISRAKTETVPVMEEVEETFTQMEPTGETRGALRYSQCSVIEAAWLRRELASLTARVSALEAV